MKTKINEKIDRSTISDFGVQWSQYPNVETDTWWGGVDGQFKDQLEPLLPISELSGKNVCDIGSGPGRIVLNLIAAGAAHVTAIEPSRAAFQTLETNTKHIADQVTLICATGENIPRTGFDIVISLGVLHHVVNPAPICDAAYRALRPGGRMIVWLYGKEGNAFYLFWAIPLREITRRLPLPLTKILCYLLTLLADGYTLLCRFLPLPMRRYFSDVYGKFEFKKRYLAIFDQLHTNYAKYYSENEARELLALAGFKSVQVYNRAGYSWTVLGSK